MDMQQSNVIAAAAFQRQQAISDAERCPSCEGMGQNDLGCAITHTIWATCLHCGGTGRRADMPEFLRRRTESEPIVCASCADTGCDLCLSGSGS